MATSKYELYLIDRMSPVILRGWVNLVAFGDPQVATLSTELYYMLPCCMLNSLDVTKWSLRSVTRTSESLNQVGR